MSESAKEAREREHFCIGSASERQTYDGNEHGKDEDGGACIPSAKRVSARKESRIANCGARCSLSVQDKRGRANDLIDAPGQVCSYQRAPDNVARAQVSGHRLPRHEPFLEPAVVASGSGRTWSDGWTDVLRWGVSRAKCVLLSPQLQFSSHQRALEWRGSVTASGNKRSDTSTEMTSWPLLSVLFAH